MAAHREPDRYGFLNNRAYQEAVGTALVRNYQPKHRGEPSIFTGEAEWDSAPEGTDPEWMFEHFDHIATDDATRIGDLI